MSEIDDWDDDRYQEYKDGVAMGYINPDGTQREPREPDWDAMAAEEHSRDAHNGGECDCPAPSAEEIEAEWAARAAQHRAEDHAGGECDCEAPF